MSTDPSSPADFPPAHNRPQVNGKFLSVADRKLYLRGVTYGTFRPDDTGHQYPPAAVVERDFALMAHCGVNSVRTYTVPPRWLLDAAQRHGLYVMVGLPWEQHVTFLDDSKRAADIEERVRAGVRECVGHPAVLCYAIGNEIPSSIVRWYGPRPIERFIERLYRAVKQEDPGSLVTYVNYPSTEYLQLPFLDLVCFNVYIESQQRYEAYLARLQNIAGDRPLMIAEIGLDSIRNGELKQAATLYRQIRSTFAGGAAGAFVFSWTDEWYRGGDDILDWEFGITRRDRQTKPALRAVARAFAEVPFPANLAWPRISVVICSYNGSRTIADALEGTGRLEYPDYEVIVVDDGSTDSTADVASRYNCRLIRTPNRGLSSARNTGLQAASGEIVAYLDDDARPDPHWLHYLAATFMTSRHAGVGGPNLAPAGDGPIAAAVANAPGGPIHVLLSDREAEHIPGCNMAFRKAALEAIGGFDPQFRVAGDDVDICWRIQQAGWTIGFSPAAMVWHHRRNSVLTYWRQQQGYGKAEALLERKWPQKYNAAGYLTWTGRIYSRGLAQMLGFQRGRIYQGTWGSALFQSLYQPAPGLLASLPLMPEWYLVVAGLAVLSLLGLLWTPMLILVPLLFLAAAAPLPVAIASARRAHFPGGGGSPSGDFGLRALTLVLHLAQPLARLAGRLPYGLHPWRRRKGKGLTPPRLGSAKIWSERWWPANQWLQSLEEALAARGISAIRGGDFDSWDLQVSRGRLGAARLRMVVEEHGGGRQYVRFRCWPQVTAPPFLLILVPLCLALAAAALERDSTLSVLLSLACVLLILLVLQECLRAMISFAQAIRATEQKNQDEIRSSSAAEPAAATPPAATVAATSKPAANRRPAPRLAVGRQGEAHAWPELLRLERQEERDKLNA